MLDRFVRLEASRHSPGSGLGLSLVVAVSKLHDARLDLQDNAPGLKAIILFPHETGRTRLPPPPPALPQIAAK